MSMWFVWKKAYKTFANNKGRTMPILVLLTFAIAFGATTFDLQDFRNLAMEEIFEKTNFADGFAQTEPLPKTTLESLLQVDVYGYLDEYEYRMILPMKFEYDGEEYDGILEGVDTSLKSHVNALVDENGNEVEDYENVLSYNFADYYGVKEGDELTLKYGSIEKELKVEEIGFNYEYTYVPLSQNVAFISFKPYPVFYLDIVYLNDVFLNSSQKIVNQFIYTLNDDSDGKEVKEEIRDALGANLKEVYTRDEHPFVESMKADEKDDRQMLLMLTIILLGGAILTLILVTSKLIEEDLKSVSVFQALGANKREIVLAYLLFNIIISSIAFICGVLLNTVLKVPIGSFMADLMGIPLVPTVTVTYSNALWIGAIMFGVSSISTLLIVKRTFKLDVQQTMKYETKFFEKPNIFERAYSKIRANPHPFVKYNLRRIFSRKLHLASLIIALSFSASLLVFFYSLSDSFAFSIERKFTDIEHWDGVATTWQFEDEGNITDEFESISNIKVFELSISELILFSEEKDGKFNETLRIMAFEEDSELHTIEVLEGEMFEKDDEVVVSKDILYQYDLKINDEIYLQSVASKSAKKYEIMGTIGDFSMSSIILSIDSAQDLLNKSNQVNTIYFTAEKNLEEVIEDVQNLPQIQSVLQKQSIEDDFNEMMEISVTTFLILGIIFTVFGLIMLLVIFKSIVDYRMEDYANFVGLGMQHAEIRKSLFYELFLYLVLSLLIGLLLGIFMMVGLTDYYSSVMPGLILYISPLSYIYYSISFIAILFVAYIYNIKRIKRINLAEIMRMKVFG